MAQFLRLLFARGNRVRASQSLTALLCVAAAALPATRSAAHVARIRGNSAMILRVK